MRFHRQILMGFLTVGLLSAVSAYAEAPEGQPEEQSAFDVASKIQEDVHHASDVDPIQAELKKCLDTHTATAEMTECQNSAYVAYDKILNQIYQQVLGKSDDKTKKALKTAQEKWNDFRKQDALAQQSYMSAYDGGTIMSLIAYQHSLSSIRERISELMFYLSNDQGE